MGRRPYNNEVAVLLPNTGREIIQEAGTGILKPGCLVTCSQTLGSPGEFTANRDAGASSKRELRINGTYDREEAMAAVDEWIKWNNMYYDRGIPLKTKTIQIDSSGTDSFTCTLDYQDAVEEKWIDEINFTTMGGTAHIDSSYQTLNQVQTTGDLGLEDYGGLIGVGSDGRPEGVDVKRPALQINVTLNWGFNVVNPAFVDNILQMSGCVNETTAFGFPPGTLLFEGANIDRVNFSDPYDNTCKYRWKVQYVFSGMPNATIMGVRVNSQTGLPVDPITDGVPINYGYVKNGWDYVWKAFATTVRNGMPYQICKQINVERVYTYKNFAALGIPYNLFTLGENIDSSGDTGW